MSRASAFLRKGVDGNGDKWLAHWCPGCDCAHLFYIERTKRPCWTFDGNVEKPTFTPSMRIFAPAVPEDKIPEQTLCHYFLNAGIINYLNDSSGHSLRGNVPLPPFPSDYCLE